MPPCYLAHGAHGVEGSANAERERREDAVESACDQDLSRLRALVEAGQCDEIGMQPCSVEEQQWLHDDGLSMAAGSSCNSSLRYLLVQLGIDPADRPSDPRNSYMDRCSDPSPPIVACMAGNLQAVDMLLRCRADVSREVYNFDEPRGLLPPAPLSALIC